MVVSLRHVGSSDALDDQLYAELVFIQDIYENEMKYEPALDSGQVPPPAAYLQPQVSRRATACGRR